MSQEVEEARPREDESWALVGSFSFNNWNDSRDSYWKKLVLAFRGVPHVHLSQCEGGVAPKSVAKAVWI